MSEILSRARRHLEQKRAELKKLEGAIRHYEKSYQSLTEMVDTAELPLERTRVLPAADMLEKIEKILVDAGRPMSGSELLRALVEVGIEISGKNPLNNLSTRLSREAARPDSRIKSKGRGQGYYVENDKIQRVPLDIDDSPI